MIIIRTSKTFLVFNQPALCFPKECRITRYLEQTFNKDKSSVSCKDLFVSIINIIIQIVNNCFPLHDLIAVSVVEHPLAQRELTNVSGCAIGNVSDGSEIYDLIPHLEYYIDLKQ